MQGVREKHPEYTREREEEWTLCGDAFEGESAVKSKAQLYLAKPSGYKLHPDGGRDAYGAYRGRAQFPEIFAPSVGAMIGIIHDTEILVEMPTQMDFLRENADGEENTLDEFHRRITRELLVMGRFGVLAEAPEGGGDPYLAGYRAPVIINWDRDFFVLDESGYVREGFKWNKADRFRVLMLQDGRYVQEVYTDNATVADEIIMPVARGGSPVPRVPFVVSGARDLVANVETPPLIGVARAAKAIYQLSADYRHQLYMSGQETLVAINGKGPDAVGAGVVHEMKGGEGLTPDLKYVSPSCSGIDAHLRAMEDNRTAAMQAGARLFEQSRAQESGEARSMRFRSETANLQTVADASCACLERALRNVAMLMGLPEDQITVTPPSDLLDQTLTPAEAQQLWQIASTGGMSWQTYYENLAAGGIANPDRDADEEFALIDDEQFRGEAVTTPVEDEAI